MDGAENRYITINSPPASQWPTGSISSLRSDLLLWGEFLLRSFSPHTKKQSMPQDYSCKHDTSAALTVFSTAIVVTSVLHVTPYPDFFPVFVYLFLKFFYQVFISRLKEMLKSSLRS